MTTSTETAKPAKTAKLNDYPWYSPRIWHGMRTRAWLGLLWRNGFRIHPFRWPMACAITFFTLLNSFLYRIQRWRFGKQIDEHQLARPPVFIVGHWRSGTTLLHELMHGDEQFASPSSYECFAPNHFLVSSGFLPSLIWFFMPAKRPMDNMAFGLDRPQEDEFAIAAMGAPSPYLRMAFPNDPPPHDNLLDMRNVPPDVLESFNASLKTFMSALTIARPLQLLLKSPPHTGRIEELSKLFPGAKFVHIVRSPYAVFPSTKRLWRALDNAQGLQIPRHENIDDYIFETFNNIYSSFEEQRSRMPEASLCDVKYEDLVANPMVELERIYAELKLEGFEAARPNFQAYLDAQSDYQPNRHQMDPELKAEIKSRWGEFITRYGYEDE